MVCRRGGQTIGPRVVLSSNAIGTVRRNGTVRMLRIAAGGQVTGRSVALVGMAGLWGDMVSRLFGRVAEWQTRWLQVPVSFGTWGFKSPFAHIV